MTKNVLDDASAFVNRELPILQRTLAAPDAGLPFGWRRLADLRRTVAHRPVVLVATAPPLAVGIDSPDLAVPDADRPLVADVIDHVGRTGFVTLPAGLAARVLAAGLPLTGYVWHKHVVPLVALRGNTPGDAVPYDPAYGDYREAMAPFGRLVGRTAFVPEWHGGWESLGGDAWNGRHRIAFTTPPVRRQGRAIEVAFAGQLVVSVGDPGWHGLGHPSPLGTWIAAAVHRDGRERTFLVDDEGTALLAQRLLRHAALHLMDN